MSVQSLTDEALLELLRKMLLIRNFELTVKELVGSGRLRGYFHLSVGEEAVAVAHAPVPFSPLLEEAFLPSVHNITAAVKEII